MTPQTLPLTQLQPAPWNARGAIDDASLAELVESIRVQGVLTPLLVRPMNGSETGAHEIIAGHRRARAAMLAGLTAVPVRIGTFTDDEAREVAIVDNLQREDIRPLDEARAYEALLRGDAVLEGATALAARIGKTVHYVWDRLQLLQLIPDAQQLLETDRVTVQHAIVLAKLTPEYQARVIKPETGGLFTDERGIPFDEDAVDRSSEGDHYQGLKPVSVRELRRYVTDHVRFDPAQAASAAPLDFGPVAAQVDAAQAQPKRGKKVIQITRDHYVQPDARADERTFCVKAWKRADGQEGSTLCDRAVLGVVVVGPGYGEAFQVCVHKDCDVHWKKERLAREKQQATVAAGGTRTTRAVDEAENRKARERQEREDQARKAWEVEKGAAAQAFAKHIAGLPFSDHVVRQVVANHRIRWVAQAFGVNLTKQTAAAVLVLSAIDLWDRDRFAAATKPFKFAWKPRAPATAKTPAPSTAKATAPKTPRAAKGKKR